MLFGNIFSRQTIMTVLLGCLAPVLLILIYTTLIYYEILPLRDLGVYGCILLGAAIAGVIASMSKEKKIYRALSAAIIPFIVLLITSCAIGEGGALDVAAMLKTVGTCAAGGIMGAMIASGKTIKRGKHGKYGKHNYKRQ